MRAFWAVFWSFFGIRKGLDLEQDAHKLRPMQIIVAGLVGAALLVGGLILVVALVIQQTS